MICWFSQQPLKVRGKYAVMHSTQDEVRCIVKNIQYRMDINTLHRDMENPQIGMNDIARVQIRTTKPLFADPYRQNRLTGSLILIDENTNETVGAGMII
jgi:sulfate adenylyltransferase subunit 1